MNLLSISIVMSCNKKCYYCPVSEWLVPLDNKFTDEVFPPYPANKSNVICNNVLLKWLDEFVNPQKFIIEITGGEPGLYKEINTLIPALNDRGYHGIIKTNGSLRIPKSRNFQLITSWHSWQVGLPKYYDQILIIKNPSDNWTSKVEYCKQHKIPYRLTLFDEYYLTGKPSICGEYNRTKFINITHINNQGQVMECPKARPDFYKSIFHSSVPPLKNLRSDCSRCNVANNVEVLLPDKLMQMIENDNKNQRII